ncbi:TPA: alpha/beta hydrolase [Streptococcus suis]|nr:alpha/beta hydrolase [Streptococcus suis]HEL1906527.1 alpha/beta hydrolase [Streptococcus suis]HEL2725488.1 alpha/beta hydrolase [Streptococcus suis]HEM2547326.1 alpha/beta hydrolase [Streptococcus suis]
MTFRELPKKWKIQFIVLSIISAFSLFILVGFHVFLMSYRETNQAQRALLVKSDSQLIGERLVIERPGNEPIRVNLYRPTSSDQANLPLVVNVHGGGFVGGDADVLDTQSQRLADRWQVVIVTVNYTKADVQPIFYGAEEIKDTVLYFAKEKATYGVDPTRFSLIGYSAGANYAALASQLLVKENVELAGLIMAYPWTTGLSVVHQGDNFPPTLFVLAGQDPISQNAKTFMKEMEAAGRTVDVVDYPKAVHSFIESNNPEGLTGATLDMSQVVNAEQESLAREAEATIGDWLKTK